MAPADAQLKAYLSANSADFEIDPMHSFQQVLLNPERRGDRIDQDAASILEVLLTSASADPASLGDASLLPPGLPLTGKTSIRQTFGDAFAEALEKAALGQWSGPIRSSFGVHLVRVSERRAGRVPTLDEARQAVVREWTNAARQELEDRRFDELLKRYEVTIESLGGAAASP